MSPPTRRAFLKTIGGAGLFCAAPQIARAAGALAEDVVQISILHTTDIHGHILPTNIMQETLTWAVSRVVLHKSVVGAGKIEIRF